MRSLMACLLIAGCSGSAQDAGETGTQFITIGADAMSTLRSVTNAQIIESDGTIAVAAIDARDLEALSARMHQEHHRCGGFTVHDSVIEAHAFMQPAVMAVPIEYSIDRPEVVKALLPKLSEGTILTTIGELQAMKNRYYRSASGAAASLWLQERWRSFVPGHRKDITVELFDHGYPQKSVIMTIPGTTRRSEVVVIGGHLDSIAPGGSSSRAPGADDDASGIATLSEVARVLLANNFQPERTIMFMGYAAEEVGLRGSLSIAKEFKKRNVDVKGVLQLDMTNYQGSSADIWIITDFTNHAQNTFLTKLIETYVGATWGFDKCGYACSDHASWHRNGFAASMPFESRSREMNRSIHTDKDTLERSSNNAAHAIKFARLGTAYAVELAKGGLEDSRLARR
jgi:bacterial leucyl aminopeptidase